MEPGLLATIFCGHLDGVVVEVEPKKVLLGMAVRMHKSPRDAEDGRSGYFVSMYCASS